MKEEDWTKKADQELKKAQEVHNIFLEKEYKKLSKNDKINYWSGQIRQQFRWNEESGVDGYMIFSKEDYELWKQIEPNIDDFLSSIAEKTRLSINRIKQEIAS